MHSKTGLIKQLLAPYCLILKQLVAPDEIGVYLGQGGSWVSFICATSTESIDHTADRGIRRSFTWQICKNSRAQQLF